VLDEFTYPIKWGWIDVAEVIEVLTARTGRQHVVITGRTHRRRWSTRPTWCLSTTKVKHPMDAGQKGQRASSV